MQSRMIALIQSLGDMSFLLPLHTICMSYFYFLCTKVNVALLSHSLFGMICLHIARHVVADLRTLHGNAAATNACLLSSYIFSLYALRNPGAG